MPKRSKLALSPSPLSDERLGQRVARALPAHVQTTVLKSLDPMPRSVSMKRRETIR